MASGGGGGGDCEQDATGNAIGTQFIGKCVWPLSPRPRDRRAAEKRWPNSSGGSHLDKQSGDQCAESRPG